MVPYEAGHLTANGRLSSTSAEDGHGPAVRDFWNMEKAAHLRGSLRSMLEVYSGSHESEHVRGV